MRKYLKMLRAASAAAKAGWIASSCERDNSPTLIGRCHIDDDTETIYACPIHEAEIARLEAINVANWPSQP